MLLVVAAVVSLVCVAASARRLVLATTLTRLDPATLAWALRQPGMAARVAIALRGDPLATWESSVLDLAAEPVGAARDAAARECLLDLDERSQLWARVPRVCASVATSTGLLCAVLGLIGGLEAEPGAPTRPLEAALTALAAGAVGACFSAAVTLRAAPLNRSRHAAAERLVELARSLAEARGGA